MGIWSHCGWWSAPLATGPWTGFLLSPSTSSLYTAAGCCISFLHSPLMRCRGRNVSATRGDQVSQLHHINDRSNYYLRQSTFDRFLYGHLHLCLSAVWNTIRDDHKTVAFSVTLADVLFANTVQNHQNQIFDCWETICFGELKCPMRNQCVFCLTSKVELWLYTIKTA